MRFAFCILLAALSACGREVERAGTIAHPEIKECSGIVASRQFPGVFWVHNDGKKERLYAINRKGATVAEFKIKGAKFQDWEDIAIDGENNLYVADTGDNDSKRAEVAVYQFPEPNPAGPDKPVLIKRQWTLRYPTGARDCESLVVIGTNGYLISKMTRNRLAEIYAFALTDATGAVTLKRLGGLALDSPATAADVTSDGKRLAVISKLGAYFFEIGGAFPSSGFLSPVRYVRLPHESIEGCAFVPEGLLVAAESRELFLFQAPSN